MSEETEKKIETRGDILYRLMRSQGHAASTLAAQINDPTMGIEKIRDLRSNVRPVGDAHIDILAEALKLDPDTIEAWKKAPATREQAEAAERSARRAREIAGFQGIRDFAARLRGEDPAQPQTVLTAEDIAEATGAPAAPTVVAADAGVKKYLAKPELIEMAKMKPGRLLAEFRKNTLATDAEKAARESMRDKEYLLPKEMVARLNKAGMKLQEGDGVKLENAAIRIKVEDIGSFIAALSLDSQQISDFTAAVQEAGFAYEAAAQIEKKKLETGIASTSPGAARA